MDGVRTLALGQKDKRLEKDKNRMNEKEKVEEKLDNTQTYVSRALRDFPELREISQRRNLHKKVSELAGEDLNPETVSRMARHLQNTLGMYTVEDNRFNLKKIHTDYFSK